MKRYLMALVSAIPLLLVLSTTISAQEIPRFEPSSCPIDVPTDPLVECGSLIVPENYDRPADDTIRLPVIIIYSPNPTPAPDPILFTAGGPGDSSLDSVWWLARTDFLKDRDIVILEQRGNLYAQPSLDCDVSVWWLAGSGQTPCLDSLKERGIDLTNYTTEAIVNDINSLRQVLDYPEWNLFGGSYSSRLMLYSMHLFPDGIRSVLLDSVSSPTETRYEHDPEHAARALGVMFADCAADPACAAAYPDLEVRFYALVSQLNAEPIPVEIRESRDGEPIEPYTVEVTGHSLVEWMVVGSFYSPTNPKYLTSYMPLLIDQLEKGNSDLLYPWVINFPIALFSGSNFAWGLYFAVNCQDDAPYVSSAKLAAQTTAYPELDGYIRQAAELAVCEAWQLPAAKPILSEPLQSDIPTLILAGSYDPITPPEWGQTVAEQLSHSNFYEFPASGHGALEDNNCATRLALAFIDDPIAVLDASCLDDLPKAAFVLPQDVIINPHIYEIHYGEVGYSQIDEIVGFSALMILVVAFFILLIAAIIWLVYGRNQGKVINRITIVTGLITAGIALLFAGFSFGLQAALRETAVATPPMIRFGLPATYRPLLLLPPTGALLTAVLIIMTVRLWRHSDTSRLTGSFFTVVTLAAVIVTVLFARWQLVI